MNPNLEQETSSQKVSPKPECVSGQLEKEFEHLEGQIKLGFKKLDNKLREIEEYKKWNLIAGARYLVSNLTSKMRQLSEHRNDTSDIQRSLQGSMLKFYNRLKLQMDQCDPDSVGFMLRDNMKFKLIGMI